jgi:molybdate-binding protein
MFALVFGHMFTLKKLATSLTALEALGANMKGYRCQNKASATVASVVVADEEAIAVPQNIEYSFDEHIDKEEFPVVSEPINYSINESST